MALLGIGQYKSVDPGFAPVPFSQLPESTKKVLAENGKQFGLDALGYYNARGGVDASGYYGDSWNAKENLTSQEYDAVIKGAIAKGLTGAQIGAAINEATAAKRSGSTINVTTGAITASAAPASSSVSASSAASRTGFEATGAPTVYTAEDGTKFTDQAAFTAYAALLQQQKATQGKVYEERRSAFQLLRDEFNRYGLGELVGDVEALIKGGLPPAEFAIELRKTPTYQKKFQANQQRINAGLVLYLKLSTYHLKISTKTLCASMVYLLRITKRLSLESKQT